MKKINAICNLNADGSAIVSPANLIEDEKRGNVKWRVSGKWLIFSDKSEYAETVKRFQFKPLTNLKRDVVTQTLESPEPV